VFKWSGLDFLAATFEPSCITQNFPPTPYDVRQINIELLMKFCSVSNYVIKSGDVGETKDSSLHLKTKK